MSPNKALQSTKTVALLASAVLLLLVSTGCGKKCQGPVGPFRQLHQTQWRLVESSDPAKTWVDNYSFLIRKFNTDFTNSVDCVVFNRRFNTALWTGEWGSPDEGQFEETPKVVNNPSSGSSGGGNTNTNVCARGLPQINQRQTYDYSTGYKLETTNVTTGVKETYVPFTGTVAPDQDCKFL